jgi:hypothetical protein
MPIKERTITIQSTALLEDVESPRARAILCKPRFTPKKCGKSHIIPILAHHHAFLQLYGQAKPARKIKSFMRSDYYSAIAQGIARHLFTENDYFIEGGTLGADFRQRHEPETTNHDTLQPPPTLD